MLTQKQIVDSWNVSQAGAFDDVADLTASVAAPRVGDYAIVGKPNGALYYWDGKAWTTPASSEVVYKAAGIQSVADRVNAYPKVADIGAAPAAKAGSVYSTFAIDTGVLSSYVANSAGTAWVAVASSSDVGVYTGKAATFAALPTARFDSGVLSTGDWSYLTAKDGTNEQGVYKWDATGTKWVFDFSISSAASFTVTLAGSAITGVNTIVSGTTSVITLPVTSGNVLSAVTVKTGTGSVSILDPFKGLVAVAGSTALDLEKTEVAATAPASADPGVYAGFATTFAALPTTRKNATALVVGDWSLLPVIDGTKLPGIYKWDGSKWGDGHVVL